MLAMDQGVVEEWLSEFKTLPETATSSYAASLKEKASLVPALYKVIRENFSDLLEPVCHQLFEFYRSGEPRLQHFTLQFLPELVWSYLSVTSGRDPRCSGCIEALLLGIYNLEIVDKDGQSKVLSFTVPSLSKPSVYHEPSTIGSLALTEGALSNHGQSRVVYSGPHLQRETFTAQNRFQVLTFLLLCYNAALSYMSSPSLQSLCQLSSRVCICGYPRQQLRRYKGISTRMTVSSEFLVQLITGIHYALCNGESDLGSKALEDVLYRAQLELFPEPLLVGNAIKSSLHGAAVKSNKEGTRSIQVEITPTASRISRNAVTSLSIRGHRWKRHDAVDLASPDELMEITEVDEGFCSQAAGGSPPSILISSTPTVGAKSAAKSQRRAGGGKGSRAEAQSESGRDQLSHKPAGGRAMSENLELLSLKRLTLTASQSVPKAGSTLTSSQSAPKASSLSLSRTASAVFSRSFEQVSNALSGGSSAHSHTHTSSSLSAPETNRYSACSLQEERLTLAVEHKQRSPSISIHLSTDL
ncbi:hyccin isoform X1 [Megalops cyprinoides]|uniref:hyccin isoform X1 n=1 Tax=Megalops cyprinoides TaxID=118141 RepID=UPI0018642E3A|nr:hyccin isoform X1 [Megalops cyprinoides]XP_036371465.1 hyccin isoform X1 [Megalops cyprinoides]XP_036371466.1 hyccin isoform X1 [Megalops cyprinoides]